MLRGRRRLILPLVIALLALGSPALAAQTVGGTVRGSGSGGIGCDAATFVQTDSMVQKDGVVTSWTLGSYWSSAKLKVVRPGASQLVSVVADDVFRPAGTYAVRIPVRQGDLIAGATKTNETCPSASNSNGPVKALTGDPAVGTTASLGSAGSYGGTIPLSAQVEADNDGDGYGDETQDQCPTNAATTGPCPLPTVLGRTFRPASDGGCTTTRLPTATGETVYRAPSAGVITSWSYQSRDSDTGTIKLKVFRSLNGASYRTVGEDVLRTVGLERLNTFPVRISVQGGDTIGLRSNGLPCTSVVSASTIKTGTSDVDAPPGESATFDVGTSRNLDVSAVLEPDADGDGFGDVSQDACPSQPATQGTCRDVTAPDTVFTTVPKPAVKARGKKTKVVFGFVSEPGARFECSVDGGAFAGCASPITLKLKRGRHTFLVRAVDATGNADASPAVASFKVKR